MPVCTTTFEAISPVSELPAVHIIMEIKHEDPCLEKPFRNMSEERICVPVLHKFFKRVTLSCLLPNCFVDFPHFDFLFFSKYIYFFF